MMPTAATRWRELDEIEMPEKVELANIFKGRA
jgi:hypothetical protein